MQAPGECGVMFGIKFPPQVTGTKYKLMYCFFKLKYTWDTGKNKSIGMFSGPFQEFAILLLLLDKYGFNFSIWELSLMILGFVIFFILFGMVVQKYKIDKIELLVHSERDPLVNDIHKGAKNKEVFG